MAFDDNKITDADLVDKGVIGLPDVPNLNTAEMQEKFEETCREVVIPKFNELIDALIAKEATDSLGSETDNETYVLTKTETTLSPKYASTIKELLTIILKELAVLDAGEVSLDFLSGVDEVVNEISDDETKLPSAAAIVAYVSHMGGGDMAKATYDRNDDGVADVAMEELTNFDGTPSEGMVPTFNELLNKWVPSGKKLAAQTLSVGATTLTFSDAIIGLSSTIDIYASKYGVAPTDVVVTTGQVELTFDPQAEAISVYLVVK